ncbi:c-type cytochrome [Puniceibacterium confluentis]|uniref:c-type cytochrome n=1 Tax=Puniceibacterium confluentis TaxID=1958944 RepID=UPI001FE9BE32|nr:cytochrome c [Puniceibacterium confluentis]
MKRRAIPRRKVTLAAGLTFMVGATAFAQQTNPQSGMAMMSDGLLMPKMNAAEGRKLFAAKGCVMCHSVNGVGGEDAPTLDAATMPLPMNPFEFAARMWRGAPAMIAMQKDEMGGQIEFTGAELADIIAFVHDPEEQTRFTVDDIPAEMAARLEKMEDGEAD